ncbi:MAG: DUF655 domain-containing protein [Haloarculaceae archaeon]
MSDSGSDGPSEAVVVDFMPNGRPNADRPRFRRAPVAYALGVSDFRLFELRFGEDADPDVRAGDRIAVSPPAETIEEMNDVDYDDLSSTARSELEYAVAELIEAEEERFVDFYNDAQPITLRLHQLNLLPGIGKKLRNNVLDARKRKPFESFDDIESRVSGLHNPREKLAERILEELREEDLKYRIFARREGAD